MYKDCILRSTMMMSIILSCKEPCAHNKYNLLLSSFDLLKIVNISINNKQMMNPAGMFEACDCHYSQGEHPGPLGECGRGGRECPDLPENRGRHLPGLPSLCCLSGTTHRGKN